MANPKYVKRVSAKRFRTGLKTACRPGDPGYAEAWGWEWIGKTLRVGMLAGRMVEKSSAMQVIQGDDNYDPERADYCQVVGDLYPTKAEALKAGRAALAEARKAAVE